MSEGGKAERSTWNTNRKNNNIKMGKNMITGKMCTRQSLFHIKIYINTSTMCMKNLTRYSETSYKGNILLLLLLLYIF